MAMKSPKMAFKVQVRVTSGKNGKKWYKKVQNGNLQWSKLVGNCIKWQEQQKMVEKALK